MMLKSPYRRIRLVLIVSLGLNLLFCGAAATVAVRWRMDPAEQVYRVALRQLTQHLGHDDAAIMRSAFADHRDQSQSARADYNRSLGAVIATLQESPVDEAKLQAAIEEARSKRMAMSNSVFEPLLDGLRGISPEGRAALLKAGAKS